MFGRVTFDNENIYLNSNRILGTISFDSEINFPYEPISIMGTGFLFQSIEGEMVKNFNFENYTSKSENNILDLIDKDVTGLFKYKSNFSQKTGNWVSLKSRLSSYELSCSVGNIPTSKFSFEGYESAGYFGSELEFQDISFDGFTVVRPGDLLFSGNNFFQTNRLQSVVYKFTIPYKKQNFIGSEFYSKELLNGPIELSVDLEFELADAESGVYTSGICENNFNGTFEFLRCGSKERRFLISGGKLISSTISASIGENSTFYCSYKSYVNNINDLKKIITGSMWQ
jgi:hypothetical protein